MKKTMKKSLATMLGMVLVTAVSASAHAENTPLTLAKDTLATGIKAAALFGATNRANVFNTTNKFKPLFQTATDSLKSLPIVQGNYMIVRPDVTAEVVKKPAKFDIHQPYVAVQPTMVRDQALMVARPPLVPRPMSAAEIDFYKNKRDGIQKFLLMKQSRMQAHYNEESASLPLVVAAFEKIFSPIQSDLNEIKARVQKGSIQDLDVVRKKLEAAQDYNNFAQTVGDTLT
jgi:hypothetical protein